MVYGYGSFSFAASSNLNKIAPQSAQKIYQKYIEDISKRNTKFQAAAGPTRPGQSPGPRGLGRAGGRLVFRIDLGYLGYILDIFLVYFLGGLGSNFDGATNADLPYRFYYRI